MSALRQLLRTPGTTAVVVLTLALAIGANSSIFSLLNAIVLRSLPIPHPEELVRLQTAINDHPDGDEPLSLRMFQEIALYQTALSEIFAANTGNINNLEVEGNHYVVGVSNVSGNYYSAMQIAPLLGRFIADSDVALNSGTSNAVAVITYRAWRNWFHGESSVIGKTIHVGTHPYSVIGVEPQGFSGLIIDGSSDITVPLFAPGTYMSRDANILWLDVYGRIHPGTTVAQAGLGLQSLWPAILGTAVPPDYDGARSKRYFARKLKMEAAAQGTSYLRKRFSHPLEILLGLVAALLLIACLNLANLSIAKIAAQRHDWSVKLALGASAWDLVRPILMESAVVALAGAALGLAIAYGASPLLLHMAWQGFVNTPLNAAPDLRVLTFTAIVGVVTGLLFALVPASYALRAEAASGLRKNSRSVHGGSSRLGRALLTAQVALSLVLVAGAMLFGKTLVSLHSVETGYKRDHLLTLQLFRQPGQAKLQNLGGYYRELSEKVAAIPGVTSVSYSNSAPASGFEGHDPTRLLPDSEIIQPIDEVVAPQFFKTMGMRILTGRDFDWNDDSRAPNVAIVSKKFAERLYGAEDPIGREFYWGVVPIQKKMRIVGVVNNASVWKIGSLDVTAVYRPMSQNLDYDEPLLDARTWVEPGSLKSTIERAIREMGHHYSLRTMTVDERLDSVNAAQRLTALLAGFFGVAAVLIAAIGLYGLMSFHVTGRTIELGVRLALGAQTWQVFSMVLREVMLIAVLGSAIGLLASVALRSYVASVLFGTSATDPVVLSVAALTLVSVSLLAGWVPARRASSVDPAIALRKE